jgi:hypothetical protein
MNDPHFSNIQIGQIVTKSPIYNNNNGSSAVDHTVPLYLVIGELLGRMYDLWLRELTT